MSGVLESGKLLFKSASNRGHSDSDDCLVTSPGSALGVFTVGALGDGTDWSGGDASRVESATIGSYSSLGGTSSEGDGRTIIDITAFGCRDYLFDEDGAYDYQGCGTSFSTPTVTAAAIDFIDFYKHHFGDFIDNPGILFVNLLLMGDRWDKLNGRKTMGFDNLYGAGRLRARKWDSAGMDSPWQFGTNYVCIDHNEVQTITINGGATISSDVGIMKAVIY